jgi:hypothetical protein
MADNEVGVNFLGLKVYPGEQGKIFEYVLEGNPRDPSGGEWVNDSGRGGFARPGRIWYPEPRVRNLDRQLASPKLDRARIDEILGVERDLSPSEGNQAGGEPGAR